MRLLAASSSAGAAAAILYLYLRRRRAWMGRQPGFALKSTPKRFAPAAALLALLRNADTPAAGAHVQARREFVQRAAERKPLVPLKHWIAYRTWVDTNIPQSTAPLFHVFVCVHTLGLLDAASHVAAWGGSDAADMLACLAEAGLLAASKTVVEWLEECRAAYEARVALRDAAAGGALSALPARLAAVPHVDALLPASSTECACLWQTALHHAAGEGHAAAALLLLERGASADARGAGGGGPLHAAAGAGRSAVMALLLARGAAPDAANHAASTPLHAAAYHGRLVSPSRSEARTPD